MQLPTMTTSTTTPTPRPPWIETPLVESAALSKAAGCRVFLKLENLQPGGSFKSRGPGNVVYQHVLQAQKAAGAGSHDKKLHFYCSSGGNAGLGCVAAATALGYPSSVAVPTTTKPHVIAQLKAAGATSVIVHGDSWLYADRHLRETVLPEARERGIDGIYVAPFEDDLIYDGNSRIIDETREQLKKLFTSHGSNDDNSNNNNNVAAAAAAASEEITEDPFPDAIICTVGGGGLFTGLQHGLRRHSRHSTPLIAVGTTGAAALATSLKAGKIVTLPGIYSIATSLGAVRIGQGTWEAAWQQPNVKPVVLSDADAAMGVWRFADDERILVEPACGVGLAICYKEGLLREILTQGAGFDFGPSTKVLVVVCGGTGMTTEIVQEYRSKYGGTAGQVSKNDDDVVDRLASSSSSTSNGVDINVFEKGSTTGSSGTTVNGHENNPSATKNPEVPSTHTMP